MQAWITKLAVQIPTFLSKSSLSDDKDTHYCFYIFCAEFCGQVGITFSIHCQHTTNIAKLHSVLNTAKRVLKGKLDIKNKNKTQITIGVSGIKYTGFGRDMRYGKKYTDGDAESEENV